MEEIKASRGRSRVTKGRTKLFGLSNNVEIGVSEIVKGISLAEPETIEREEHLDGSIFRFIEAVRAFR